MNADDEIPSMPGSTRKETAMTIRSNIVSLSHHAMLLALVTGALGVGCVGAAVDGEEPLESTAEAQIPEAPKETTQSLSSCIKSCNGDDGCIACCSCRNPRLCCF
jgi:hypothetical protein